MPVRFVDIPAAVRGRPGTAIPKGISRAIGQKSTKRSAVRVEIQDFDLGKSALVISDDPGGVRRNVTMRCPRGVDNPVE